VYLEHQNGTLEAVTFYKRKRTLIAMIKRHSVIESGEAKVLCAVLARAIHDFGTEFHLAAFWRNGSADTICRALGLEPKSVHQWANRLKLPLRANIRRVPKMRLPTERREQ
jgi:hypothetical protein